MRHSIVFYGFICMFCLNLGCSSDDRLQVSGEYIYRNHDEYLYQIRTPNRLPLPAYPWDKTTAAGHYRITKEFFRCRGDSSHDVKIITPEGSSQSIYYRDCQGDHHSLPLRDGKEYIYPCLIDLLNYVQEKTGKRVVVTCGHRCPTHNAYADHSRTNQTSKHLIGAEVDFYVEGLENEPDKIIELLQQYYRENDTDPDLLKFQRWDRGNNTVAVQPWYNKEIFVKLYGKDEGRDFDNQHAFPYIGIQVRFDRTTQEKVVFNAKQSQNFKRR